jgi:hypothetical protein
VSADKDTEKYDDEPMGLLTITVTVKGVSEAKVKGYKKCQQLKNKPAGTVKVKKQGKCRESFGDIFTREPDMYIESKSVDEARPRAKGYPKCKQLKNKPAGMVKVPKPGRVKEAKGYPKCKQLKNKPAGMVKVPKPGKRHK